MMDNQTIDEDLILTQQEAFTLAEILDMNLFQIIRNDPDIDNIDWLLNVVSAYNKLRKRGKYGVDVNDPIRR